MMLAFTLRSKQIFKYSPINLAVEFTNRYELGSASEPVAVQTVHVEMCNAHKQSETHRVTTETKVY